MQVNSYVYAMGRLQLIKIVKYLDKNNMYMKYKYY
jgi:hypothetical protein